jgi:hypothetical protein
MAEIRYCWRCYARQPVDAAAGAWCVRCGESTAEPAGTSWTDKLLWALSHPLVERRIIAARSLARLGERRAVAPLSAMARGPDPYLAAAAVRALEVFDEPAVDDVLQAVAREGPAPARRAAQEVLRRRTAQTGLAERAAPGAVAPPR